MRDGQSQYSKVVSPRAFISMKLSKKLRASQDSINVNIMQVNIKLKINFKGTLISFHTLVLVEVVLPNPVLKKSNDSIEVLVVSFYNCLPSRFNNLPKSRQLLL